MTAAENAVFAWHYVQFVLPADWEPVRFRNDPASGEFHFGTRQGEALQLHWRRLAGEPALERRLAELVESSTGGALSSGEARRRFCDVGGWLVHLPAQADAPVFAGRFLAEAQVLLNLTFPPRPGADARPDAERVLRSFAPNLGPERRWAVYGMDVRLPEAYVLMEFLPLPSFQQLHFETRKGWYVTLTRYAMLSRLLARESIETFCARVKGRRFRLFRRSTFRKDGRHDGVELSYATRGTGGIMALTSPIWEGQMFAWRCDARERLYILDHQAPARHRLPDLLERAGVSP